MTDKMRERFEKWARAECFDVTSIGGYYSDNETNAAYKAWQAAQQECKPSESVPVVGEPVAWTGSGSLNAVKVLAEGFIWGESAPAHPVPLYLAPTVAITEQELDALRKDADWRKSGWVNTLLLYIQQIVDGADEDGEPLQRHSLMDIGSSCLRVLKEALQERQK